MVSPEVFFSLQRFAHRFLWKEGEPVWSALVRLSDYLKGLEGKVEIEVREGVVLEGRDISIGTGTVIEPGVYIKGPCAIGKGCVIRHGAYIRGDVICGDGCVVGHGAELKHSVLLDGACAAHFAYVGDSILGNGVNLGAGVKCANVRLDKGEVSVQFEGTRFKTGLKKLGPIVGDGVQVGCNCVLNPGTLIGKESVLYPLLNVGGEIPARSIVKAAGMVEPLESLGAKLLKSVGK